MISSVLRRLLRFVLALAVPFAFAPAITFAQTPTADAPFESIGKRLKVGQVAEVTDKSGLKVKGRVTEITPARIVITRGSGRQTLTGADVRAIKRVGSIWDGAAKGAIVGAIPWAFISKNCQSCGELAAMSAAIGAGIGLGVDALFGPRTVYRARPSSSRVANIVPIVSRDRKGLRAAIAF